MLDTIPEGQDVTTLAPDLRMASERLKPDWISDWMVSPLEIQPGTRMPGFFTELPGSFYPQLDQDTLLFGVFLHDIDDMNLLVDRSLEKRRAEAGREDAPFQITIGGAPAREEIATSSRPLRSIPREATAHPSTSLP